MSLGKTVPNGGQQPVQGSMASVMPCPYHSLVLAMPSSGHQKGLSPMDRFLAEGPAEQSALFIRGDTGKLSNNKDCTCANNTNTT